MNTQLKITSDLNGLARRLVIEASWMKHGRQRLHESNRKQDTPQLAHQDQDADPCSRSAASDEYGIPMIDVAVRSPGPISLVSEALIEDAPCPFTCG